MAKDKSCTKRVKHEYKSKSAMIFTYKFTLLLICRPITCISTKTHRKRRRQIHTITYNEYVDLQLHADLWDDPMIHIRHVDGAEDITFGEHPQLGICIVSHYGFESCTRWLTLEPIDSTT